MLLPYVWALSDDNVVSKEGVIVGPVSDECRNGALFE